MMPLRPLKKDEVRKELHQFVGFNSQGPRHWRDKKQSMILVTCPSCKKTKPVQCSNIRSRGEKWTARCGDCKRWKGGRSVNVWGYVVRSHRSFSESEQSLLEPMFRQNRKGINCYSILEHRAIMALSLGRPLAGGEKVHHINRNKTDNRRGNLRLVNHHREAVCPRCGWPMEEFDSREE